jgi:hypothetical protein
MQQPVSRVVQSTILWYEDSIRLWSQCLFPGFFGSFVLLVLSLSLSLKLIGSERYVERTLIL